ncbi:hypothetical protein GCM10011514_30360 [Emticicia aquatilis]|uniref:FAD/NAD(P)-binding domain-containing protein n=1 Tax=Emticicia aquatilis TaxID=1537369 RepID=A0A916YXC3_9BACT|nr:FAD-dependent oxidoreductase [Emticicia aquatilis]GGD64336.1 hypothetical protein GCM10011514_30360 [Emticicia aquatilis]
MNHSEEFLDNLEVNGFKDIYYIGTQQRGITIFKQQVRALNLIYTLEKTSKIQEGSRIAIIGGGIGGVTASAAALSIGCKVYLYENKPILMHLQTGCKTRWVHPNIYDWPSQGSEFPYAGLPLLNWKEGYSSDVAQEMLTQYGLITKKHANNYRECLGVRFEDIDFSTKKIFQEYSTNKDHIKFDAEFDIIIVATGFGIEGGFDRNSLLNDSNSYWRNDDLDQPYIGKTNSSERKIIISGTGDGALVDLLRSTLINFHQGRLIFDFFSNSVDIENIKEQINKIKENAGIYEDTHSNWLYRKFEELPNELLIPLKEYIHKQKRQDTKVTLLGRQSSISDIFSTKKMSIFNAFIVYLLHTTGCFDYYGVAKISKKKDKKIKIDFLKNYKGLSSTSLSYDVLIMRHGPAIAITDSLKSLGIIDLKFKDSIDTSNRIWDAGWPSDYIDKVHGTEFVPPLTKAIVTTFVEILSQTLSYFHKESNPSFRVSLNRFIEINNSIFFQQLCRYGGTIKYESESNIGRIFNAKFGLVGYAAAINEAVLLRRKGDFDKAVSLMDVDSLKSNPIRPSLNSMLAIPIYSLDSDNNKKINCALYIDSSEIDFFSDKVIDLIINTCQGFIITIDKMVVNNDIKVVKSQINGTIPAGNKHSEKLESIKIGEQISSGLKEKLYFNKITSLDIYE